MPVPKRPNPTVVGAFILGGALLMVAAVAIWGSGRLFARRHRYVCYFSGSVNGLELNGKRVRELGSSDEPTPRLAEELIRQGLRARLESQSFVTGQLYVNLDI